MREKMLSNSVIERFEEGLETAAYSIATGKEAFADTAVSLFGIVARSEGYELGDGAATYVKLRRRAEVIAVGRGAPLKPQSDNSEKSQKSKMENFAILGVAARTNDAVVAAIDYAAKVTTRKYTPLVKAAGACKRVLAKNPRADEPTLCKAIDDALIVEKDETLSKALGTVLKAFDKLRDGSEDAPSPHEAMVLRVINAHGSGDLFEAIAQRLTVAKALAEKMEAADAPVPVLSE